jgi:hypothetical protein
MTGFGIIGVVLSGSVTKVLFLNRPEWYIVRWNRKYTDLMNL